MIKIATSETAQVWATEPDGGVVKVAVRGQSDFDAHIVGMNELRALLPLYGFEITEKGYELLANDSDS